jgi:hypothetical protein
MEMLELYLHKANLISTGKIIKHSWFKRPRPEQKLLPLIDRKLPVEFEGKEKIYDLIYSLEEHRDALIYGKSNKEEIEFVVEKFFELKKILIKKLEEVGEKIE